MLPLGRLKLGDKSRFHRIGSVPLTVTIGIEEVAAFAERAATSPPLERITATLLANQVSREHRQSIVLALRPTKFNRHVLTVDVTRLIQIFAKGGDSTRSAVSFDDLVGVRRWSLALPAPRLIRPSRKRFFETCDRTFKPA